MNSFDAFSSQATTLEELKKELELKKLQAKQEFDQQEKEIIEMKKHQAILQKDLTDHDKVEKELTAEIELARERIADRKRKENELSRNSEEIKEQYYTTVKELTHAQKEYENVVNKKEEALARIDSLKDEIENLKKRKEEALEMQIERKKEYNNRTKQLLSTEKEYLDKEAILKKEIEKWEGELNTTKSEYKKEEDELNKKIETVDKKLSEAKGKYTEAKASFDAVRREREIEVGGVTLEDKYAEHDHLVEEIYILESLLEFQKKSEDFFLLESERLLKEHEQRLLREVDIDNEEANNLSKKTPATADQKKSFLQKKKQGRYGTAEHFMLRKVVAEIELTEKVLEVSKSFVPSLPVADQTIRQEIVKESVLEMFKAEQSKFRNNDKLFEYVEVMRILKNNKKKEAMLKKAISKLSEKVGHDVSDIVEMIDKDPYDDYPINLNPSDNSNGQRAHSDEFLVKSRIDDLLNCTPETADSSRLVDPNNLLHLHNHIKQKDLEIKWLETKRKVLDAYKEKAVPNLKRFEELQLQPQALGLQTVTSTPFHYELRRKPEERATYLHTFHQGKIFRMLESDDSGLLVMQVELVYDTERKQLFVKYNGSELNVIDIKDIVDVVPGFQTRELLIYGDVNREEFTFSIITTEVCINLEIVEEKEKRDFYVKSLIALLIEATK